MKLFSLLILGILLSAPLHAAFSRPMPPLAKPGFDPATGTITDSRWKSGVPLGGIGVGKIEVLTDGGFGNFTNQHNWDRPYGWAKGAFAAIRVQAGKGTPVAKLLRLAGPDEYVGVTNVAHTQTQGWFPRAEIAYSDPALPVKVRLDAFSPLIPHNPKDSSLPVACLTYTVTNSTAEVQHVSVLLAWPNLLGWGGGAGAAWDNLAGDRQEAAAEGPLRGLRYVTSQNYSNQQENAVGEDFIGANAQNVTVTACPAWDTADATPGFWKDFAASGHLGAAEAQDAKKPAGAVSAETTLAPGASRTLRFYVAWAMPHMITAQTRTVFGPETDKSQADTAALFDADPATRWSTGRAMQPGDALVIDLGAARDLARVSLDSGKKNPDYPRGLRVEVSDDAQHWHVAAVLTADAVSLDLKNGVLDVPLAGVRGRCLRLTNLGAENFYWWSAYGLSVYAAGQNTPLALPRNAATASLVRSQTKNVAEDVGHYWQNSWKTAPEMAAYADENSGRLLRETRAWQDLVLESSLPFWLQLKLINCAFPLYTNTILTRSGRFVVQESPIDMGGATGTMDQRMAAHAFYTSFFPELDRAELESYANCQQADGRITHFDGNIHEVIGRPDVGYGITDWPDLSSGWVLQVAKLYRWTGDKAFLSRMAPHVTRAMDWLERDGADDDLIPVGGSTYDYEQLPHGAFIYSASCYLGALRAASALAPPAQAKAYDAHLSLVQQSVMRNLWNGTFFRKWKDPNTGKAVEDSFVANLAGDWLTRIAGLPRTLAPGIIHQSIAQTIARHQKPFFPVPPMQVTPDGRMTTTACYLLQHEPYLGCEAIYENYVDDGLETLRRVYLCAWELNHSPWDESLVYTAPDGGQGGLRTYMTCPTSWFVLSALSGLSLNLPRQTLFVSPRLATGQTELHLPVFFPRFWGRLDYVPAAHMLSLHIDRVFPIDAALERTLYRLPGLSAPGKDAALVLSTVAADGDAVPIALPHPFAVLPGATLNLSADIARLIPHGKSEVVNFSVKAPIKRSGLPADGWTLTDNLRDPGEMNTAFGALALDGNATTRWTTDRPMQPGDQLTLNFGKTLRVAKLVLDDTASPGDYPRGYMLEASADGKTWTQIARATAAETTAAQQQGVLAITFPPTDARALRVTNLEAAPGLFWSVHELSVYGP